MVLLSSPFLEKSGTQQISVFPPLIQPFTICPLLFEKIGESTHGMFWFSFQISRTKKWEEKHGFVEFLIFSGKIGGSTNGTFSFLVKPEAAPKGKHVLVEFPFFQKMETQQNQLFPLLSKKT